MRLIMSNYGTSHSYDGFCHGHRATGSLAVCEWSRIVTLVTAISTGWPHLVQPGRIFPHPISMGPRTPCPIGGKVWGITRSGKASLVPRERG